MTKNLETKKSFAESKKDLFENVTLRKDSFKFCINYSLLIEEYIYRVVSNLNIPFAIAASGSFSRRELSPYSDIDVLFIVPKLEGNEEIIQTCVTNLWDSGIEVSHTVRAFDDIKVFLESDLHAFTQFFETRFLIGNEEVFQNWNKKLFGSIKEKHKTKLIKEFFIDVRTRHKKYGKSPKVLEPNIKFSAGGLRDMHVVEWMYCLKNGVIISDQSERTQSEIFMQILRENNLLNEVEIRRIEQSYKLILLVRNLLHLVCNKKNDRLEFTNQEKIAQYIDGYGENWQVFMKAYFNASSIINRFSRTMLLRFELEIYPKVSDKLAIELDEDFILKDGNLSIASDSTLTFSGILRGYYYRTFNKARFDEELRSLIIEIIGDLNQSPKELQQSSVFFREILKVRENVGENLTRMNELGVLSAFMPEWNDLIGFFQPGVYHCYTADEHTLIALQNLEDLKDDGSLVGKLFFSLESTDIIYLAVLFHDIAKPISLSGHEIIGAEIAASIMERLGYELEEINLVKFLVRHHLTMEQVAFRRDLSDSSTLNEFAKIFPSVEALDLLYLLTFADLSAVSPVVWTQWKSDLLSELYYKTKRMLLERLSGEELLLNQKEKLIKNEFDFSDPIIREHIEAIDDVEYLSNYTQDEINAHVNEIESGSKISVFFKEDENFTNVSVITRDSKSLLTKLCGALSINDLNIHDAKIFTRNDGIIIDSFNVTDFRTHKIINKSRYEKIENDLTLAVQNELAIGKEFNKVKSKWWRLETKLFSKVDLIKIVFERHNKFTIIDVFAPDKLGLLYQVTKTMNELGLSIQLAKISTKSDDVVDSFYVLDRDNKKVSQDEYELIRIELTKAIEELL